MYTLIVILTLYVNQARVEEISGFQSKAACEVARKSLVESLKEDRDTSHLTFIATCVNKQ